MAGRRRSPGPGARGRLTAALLILAAAACADGAPATGGSTGEDAGIDPGTSAAMDSVYARFTRAYALTEPDSVLALYDDIPFYLPARGDIRRGRAAVREEFAFLDDLRERGATPRISFTSVDRGAEGDLAYDVGYYRLRTEDASGEALGPASRGKFVTVWRRDPDGRWRIRVDGFSPAPPPAPGPEG